MKKIILIHGRDQQNKDRDELKQLWVDHLCLGFERAGLTIPAETEFEFPYYADMMIEAIQKLKKANDIDIYARGDDFDDRESLFYEELLSEIAHNAGYDQYELIATADEELKQRGIENTKVFLKLAKAMDSNPVFGDLPIRWLTSDVYDYLNRDAVRYAVDHFVMSRFDQEATVVIGHSLGSVVAYNALINDSCPKNIKAFITIGSPLGLNSIKKSLSRPLRKPASLNGEWYNAFDPKDIVALRPLNEKYFPVLPPIINDSTVLNHSKNHHGIEDYISHPGVAKAIYEGLEML